MIKRFTKDELIKAKGEVKNTCYNCYTRTLLRELIESHLELVIENEKKDGGNT